MIVLTIANILHCPITVFTSINGAYYMYHMHVLYIHAVVIIMHVYTGRWQMCLYFGLIACIFSLMQNSRVF